MSKFRSFLIVGLLTVSMVVIDGCSNSSNSSPGGTLTNAASGIAQATTTLERYTPYTKDVNKTAFNSPIRQFWHALKSIFAIPSAMATLDSSLIAVWTTSGIMSDLYNGATETIQGYMGQMFDSEFQTQNGSATGAVGRYENAMFQVCLSMTLATSACGTDTDGLPPVGTCSFTIDLSALPTNGTYQGCPVPPGAGGGSGTFNITATIAAVSGNSSYTKSMTAASGPGGGGGIVYMKLNSSAGIFNMESVSPNDNPQSSAACGGSRWILGINGNVTDLEYEAVNTPNGVNSSCNESGSSGMDQMYRFHIDTGNNVAYVLGFNAQAVGASPNGTAFIMSDSPTALAGGSPNVSVSFWTNTGSSMKAPTTTSTFLDSSADGCVAASTGTAESSGDGALACDLTGIDVVTAESMLTSYYSSHVTSGEVLGTITPSAIPWTGASNFATAAVSP
jgi:hypothetical protein